MASPTLAAGAYASAQGLLSGAGAAKPALSALAGGAAPKPDFGALVANVLQATGSAGASADAQAMSAVQGKADLVDVVTAVAESEAAIETLVAVRDRVIAAYEEIMRMPM